MTLETYNGRNACFLSYVLPLCSSLLDGSICREYDARYFYGRSNLSTVCKYRSPPADPISEFYSIMVYTRRLL